MSEVETFQTAHKMKDTSNQTLSDSALSIPSRTNDQSMARDATGNLNSQNQDIANNEAEATTADNYTGPVLRPRKQNTTKPNITRPGPLSDLTPPAALPKDMPRVPAQASSRPQRVRQPPTRYRRASASKPSVVSILAQALVSLAKQSD